MAPLDKPREFLRSLLEHAVQRALPAEVIKEYLPTPPRGRTVVIGAGKAAAAMAQAVEALWPADRALSGAVVTRYGHTPARPAGVLARIEVLEAAHPVPDPAGVAAAHRMFSEVRGLSADDLVLCLMSGGASSLLTLPIDGLTIAQKQDIHRQLLMSGARISEMNLVRRHLSRVKGGQLALACRPAPVVTLAISDVPGDDPAVIGSGPTIASQHAPQEALRILDRYRIAIPDLVRQRLEAPLDAAFDIEAISSAANRVELIATPWQSLQAAADAARAAGLSACILSDSIEGESREVAKVHAEIARAIAHGKSTLQRPCVLLSGGETSVTVDPSGPRPGRGGRAGEFCLGLAQALRSEPGIWALAADTDGIDGVESNAGAFVTPETIPRAEARCLSLQAALDRHDSFGFFDALDDLVVTGPTHTNVNDFRAILIA